MTPRVVLFDLDGTLVDTYRLYLEAYRRALAPHLDRPPTDQEIIARRPTSERRFLAEWVGADAAERCHAAMVEQYHRLHDTLCDGLYDGTREMLDALRAAGLRLGIVSGKGRAAWETTSSALGLGPFAVVVTDDDVASPKPDPEGLRVALAGLDATPEIAVYVGDSRGDLEAGRNAGTLTAAALWPKTAPGERDAFVAEIAELEPDWTFDRPSDITRSLGAWCGITG